MPDLPASFHPLIRDWFVETYGKPTAVQAQAWPLIEQGRNVLALAPTGSGKTLTAFMSAISRFCPSAAGDAAYPADRLAALYVSPLKALNEDIRRNLLKPLEAIRARFEAAGLSFPAVRVETRSGDTPQSERRRFLLRPPSILALTPESLAILLLNPKGRQALSTVRYLILDEIHAVLGNKRGSYLSCQIDRLAMVAGEFQRISLSATVRPPESAAAFVAGLAPDGQPRPISIVAPANPRDKQIELVIDFCENSRGEDEGEADRQAKCGRRYGALIGYILSRISANSTLLVFTDSRRRAERISYCINQEAADLGLGLGMGGAVSFAHHGSLSKDLRQSVERRLAAGQLPCVVATASLELGIDIGSVDEVLLAGSPGSVAQALQRIGRSGHSVGKVSRGRLFPFHGMDLLLGAALKSAVEDRDIEEVRPIENPLDILAQIIVALCAEKAWDADELYATLRGFYAFRSLHRESYNRVLRMLAGCGKSGRLREIKPRIRLDGISGEASGLDGNLLLLYSSGGVIANRGLYSMRFASHEAGSADNAGIKIGELDEEFVWERRVGDRFSFGGKGWQITGIGAEAVEVLALEKADAFMPFWRADTFFRSAKISSRVLALLDRHSTANPEGPPSSLPPPPSPHGKAGAIEGGDSSHEAALALFLDTQRLAQGSVPLSGSTNITVEIIDSLENGGDFYTAVVHSFRGGAVNYPLSLALSGELEEALQIRVETFSNDDAILFLLPRRTMAGGILETGKMISRAFAALGALDGAVKGAATGAASGMSRGERLFRNWLETSGVFGANFREAAERSLLLPKAGFGKRTPLWIMRQRSKRLFDAVSREGDFPVTAEAWRSCLVDTFDMEGFRDLLSAVSDGSIALSFFASKTPSPFSRDVVWRETNTLLYETDEQTGSAAGGGGGGRSATLSDKVIQEALGDAALRPALKPELVEDFAKRLRREAPGWAPEDAASLCEWVKERIAIPIDEWETLLASMLAEARFDGSDPYIDARIKKIQRSGAGIAAIVHKEWETAWQNEALTLLGPWLRYEGPVSISRIAEVFGAGAADAEDAASALAEVGEAILDVALEAAPSAFVCDRENLEMLLRLSRRKARPEIKERPASALFPFLALRQGLDAASAIAASGAADRAASSDAASAAFLKKLSACAAAAKLWETELCPARCGSYAPEMLDREIREGGMIWYGAGKERIGLCMADDLDLVLSDTERKPKRAAGSKTAPPARVPPARARHVNALHANAQPSRAPPAEAPPPKALPAEAALVAEAFAKAIGAGFFDRPRDFWEIREKAAELLAENAAAAQAQRTGAVGNNASGNAGSRASSGASSGANGSGEPRGGASHKACAEALWGAVWQGQLSADSFEPIRRGVENGFAPKETESAERGAGAAGAAPMAASFAPRLPRIPRALRNRWKDGAPVRGAWFSLALDYRGEDSGAGESAGDALPFEMECRNRSRVRLLLARWGILCRPLFENESAPFSWSGLLPTMRRMELAGELVAGRFFAGINSLQFASPAIAAELEKADAFGGIYWMNAADPASLAGLGIEGLDRRIPSRLPTNRLYFRGAQLIAVSKRNGREMQIFIAPDDPDIAALIELFKAPRARKAMPEKKILVEKISGAGADAGGADAGSADAAKSDYAGIFRAAGFLPDRGRLCFW